MQPSWPVRFYDLSDDSFNGLHAGGSYVLMQCQSNVAAASKFPASLILQVPCRATCLQPLMQTHDAHANPPEAGKDRADLDHSSGSCLAGLHAGGCNDVCQECPNHLLARQRGSWRILCDSFQCGCVQLRLPARCQCLPDRYERLRCLQLLVSSAAKWSACTFMSSSARS